MRISFGSHGNTFRSHGDAVMSEICSMPTIKCPPAFIQLSSAFTCEARKSAATD